MADEFTKAALYGISNFNRKVKEEIGMGKLLILIDIYEEEVVGVHSVGEKITDKEEARIISKKFGFIKWLVENEKIEWNLDKMLIHYGEQLSLYPINYEHLLMLLAIQDEPIEFLISLLK